MSVKEGNLLKEFMLFQTIIGGRLFRCNTGQGWVGKSKTLPNGDVLIKNARRFSTGWPKGTSDLIGFTPMAITQDMVGKMVAVFTAIEGKTGNLKASEEQDDFLNMVYKGGGISTVAHKQEDINEAMNQFFKRYKAVK